jgi:large-conductance mechanosensitive channel
VKLKRIIGFLVIAFLLFIIITQPQATANLVSGILAALRTAAEGVAAFLQGVF